MKCLQDQHQQKEKDYQALRAETLKVIQGTSRLSIDLLNSLIAETELKNLENQMRTAEQELKKICLALNCMTIVFLKRKDLVNFFCLFLLLWAVSAGFDFICNPL